MKVLHVPYLALDQIHTEFKKSTVSYVTLSRTSRFYGEKHERYQYGALLGLKGTCIAEKIKINIVVVISPTTLG